MSNTATTTAPKAAKTPKPLNACWCGRGGQTKNRFVPGHDARFHGWAKKAARCELDVTETLEKLPHADARAEFVRHVELEIPKAEAKALADEAKEAAKLAKAAAKAAEKAAKAVVPPTVEVAVGLDSATEQLVAECEVVAA